MSQGIPGSETAFTAPHHLLGAVALNHPLISTISSKEASDNYLLTSMYPQVSPNNQYFSNNGNVPDFEELII